jgi:hypothetical protein
MLDLNPDLWLSCEVMFQEGTIQSLRRNRTWTADLVEIVEPEASLVYNHI